MPTEKNIALLCNPLAGVGKASQVTARLSAALEERNISFSLFNKNWPLSFERFTEVWVVGGDGTLNYFVNQYIGITIPVAVFKGGTGNDFHWLLYGEISLEEQLGLVLNASPKLVDIGKCNEKYFLNGTGIGFEGAVVRSLTGKKKWPGKTSFYITILKKIFFYRSRFYRIQDGEKVYEGNKLMVSVTNGRRAGGGFHISPQASADDGLLDIVLVNSLHPVKRLRYLPVIEKGRHLTLSFITHFRTTGLQIKSDQLMYFHLDGEFGSAAEISISILPHRFPVLY